MVDMANEIIGEILEIREVKRGVYTVITTEAWKDIKGDDIYVPAFGCPEYIKEINRRHIQEIRKYWPGIDSSQYV